MSFYDKILYFYNTFILDLFRNSDFSRKGSNSGLQHKIDPVLAKFYDIGRIVIPVILSVGAILIIIRLILLGVKLAQNGDDPERRSKIIKGMIWWGVGLIIVVVAIAVSGAVLTVLTGKSKLPDKKYVNLCMFNGY